MINPFFASIEACSQGARRPLTRVLDNLAFDANGLIPAIAQDHQSREVLMMAWMNREVIDQTLTSGNMTYWSRSRSQLWRKGETSGHCQQLKTLLIDCDGDTLLCEVEQQGPACHTRRNTCFYLLVEAESNSVKISV